MIRYESPLIGQTFTFGELRDRLEELGFHLNETFTYRFGAFDYVLEKSKSSYDYYLRLTVSVVKGFLESADAVVKIEEIYAIGALYHHGFQDHLDIPQPLQKKAQEIVTGLPRHLSRATQARTNVETASTSL